MSSHEFTMLLEHLRRIEAAVTALSDGQAAKDWYTTAEVAAALGKAPFTVRQWCRQGRVRARKRPCGRGLSAEWVIAHDELLRIRNEGLLPPHGP